MKLVKSVSTRRYEVTLYQTEKDMFVILYANHGDSGFASAGESEKINNYQTASMLFDIKLREFEGN